MLVYLSHRQDDTLLGSVYLKNQSIETAIEDIKKVRHVLVCVQENGGAHQCIL